jgi:predicted transcriptional regulator
MDITIELEPQIAAIVKELAAQTDRSPEWIIATAIEIYVDAVHHKSPEQTAFPHGTATKSP